MHKNSLFSVLVSKSIITPPGKMSNKSYGQNFPSPIANFP